MKIRLFERGWAFQAVALAKAWGEFMEAVGGLFHDPLMGA